MKKVLVAVSLFFVLVSCTAVWWISRLEKTIEEKLSDVFMTEVHVGDIRLSWNKMEILDFYIVDPEDKQRTPLFEAKKIDLTFDIKSMLSQMMWVIEKMEIQHPEMRLVMFSQDGKDSNWSRMLAKADERESSTSKGYLFKEVLIEHTQLTARGGPLGGRVVKSELEPIHLNDVGSHKPLPVEKVAKVISRALVDRSMILLEFMKLIPKTLLKEIILPFSMMGPAPVPVKFMSNMLFYKMQ